MTGSVRQFTIRNAPFTAPPLAAGLYVVSTPIGNLSDITIRALETLAACDVIACEDTRTSGVLAVRYGISQPKVSYNEHNADTRGPDLLRQIEEGAAVALISDAGTPLVSDPGTRLVREAIERGLTVVPIPGASAPLVGLVGSGLSGEDFRFLGFLPNKAGARAKALAALTDAPSTLIFFEGPSRVVATLTAMRDAFGPDRRAVIARELTKLYETFERGTLAELTAHFTETDRIRGEFVILVQGAAEVVHDADDVTTLLLEAMKDNRTKDAAVLVAAQTGLPRQTLYQQALALKNEAENKAT